MNEPLSSVSIRGITVPKVYPYNALLHCIVGSYPTFSPSSQLLATVIFCGTFSFPISFGKPALHRWVALYCPDFPPQKASFEAIVRVCSGDKSKIPVTHSQKKLLLISNKWLLISNKWLLILNKWLLIPNKWVFILNKWLFILNKWLFISNKWLFIFNKWLFIFNQRLFILNKWLFIFNKRLFILNKWLLFKARNGLKGGNDDAFSFKIPATSN